MPDEIEACERHLFQQVELIQPRSSGRWATSRRSSLGQADRDHARPRPGAGGHARRPERLLYPLYHPAAALYTPSMLNVLREDFARIPQLLGRAVEPRAGARAAPRAEPAVQLGLFRSTASEPNVDVWADDVGSPGPVVPTNAIWCVGGRWWFCERGRGGGRFESPSLAGRSSGRRGVTIRRRGMRSRSSGDSGSEPRRRGLEHDRLPSHPSCRCPKPRQFLRRRPLGLIVVPACETRSPGRRLYDVDVGPSRKAIWSPGASSGPVVVRAETSSPPLRSDQEVAS